MKKICASVLIITTVLCAGVFAREGDPIAVEEDTVVAQIGGVRQVVGYLAFSDDPFFGFGQTYAFSPEGDAIAYIGEEKGSFGLYVYQAGKRFAVLLPSHGEITGRTFPVWSPDGDLVTYSVGNRIWMFDPNENDAWIVTEPEDPFYEDIDPAFSDDGWSIFFYRGTTFEFAFSGELFNVGLDGSGLTWIEEPYPKYPPEYFGGPEDEDPYIYTSQLLIESKAALFAMDLENHDYERLLTHFPGWFVVMAFEISGDLGGPIDERVVSYEVDSFSLEVYFTVELYDRREVVFYLMFDQDTLQFVGASG